jgi:hypothetical protein
MNLGRVNISFEMQANHIYPKAPQDQARVVSQALLRAADSLALTAAELARIIGASEASLSRVRHHTRDIALDSKEGELGLLFLRVFRSLDALLGGDQEHARAWLRAQNDHLRGVPLERMYKVEGLVDVAEYLDALRGAF